jgi:hypothetical protein
VTEFDSGYGNPQCFNCPIILDEEMAAMCRIMVFYTRQQEIAARQKNWVVAIFWEFKQNRLALEVLKCTPGFNRV